jgi:hypothetical protein
MGNFEQITDRPSYSGHSAETLRQSARIAAHAHGVAYILATVSIPEIRAGGHVFVSTEQCPQWPGGPYATLETVTE